MYSNVDLSYIHTLIPIPTTSKKQSRHHIIIQANITLCCILSLTTGEKRENVRAYYAIGCWGGSKYTAEAMQRKNINAEALIHEGFRVNVHFSISVKKISAAVHMRANWCVIVDGLPYVHTHSCTSAQIQNILNGLSLPSLPSFSPNLLFNKTLKKWTDLVNYRRTEIVERNTKAFW